MTALETPEEAAARAIAPLLKQIGNDAGLLPAEMLPQGCAVKVAGNWFGFEGMQSGAMVLSTGSAGCTYIPNVGEVFVWSSPF